MRLPSSFDFFSTVASLHGALQVSVLDLLYWSLTECVFLRLCKKKKTRVEQPETFPRAYALTAHYHLCTTAGFSGKKL